MRYALVIAMLLGSELLKVHVSGCLTQYREGASRNQRRVA